MLRNFFQMLPLGLLDIAWMKGVNEHNHVGFMATGNIISGHHSKAIYKTNEIVLHSP